MIYLLDLPWRDPASTVRCWTLGRGRKWSHFGSEEISMSINLKGKKKKLQNSSKVENSLGFTKKAASRKKTNMSEHPTQMQYNISMLKFLIPFWSLSSSDPTKNSSLHIIYAIYQLSFWNMKLFKVSKVALRGTKVLPPQNMPFMILILSWLL